MKNISLLILAFIIISCSGEEKKLPKDFDFGEAKNGLYKNDYFDMEIKFNKDWVVQDQKQMNDLVERGNDLVTGDNEELKSVVKASQVNTAYLLSIFKYEVGSPVDYNPSFMAVAENTKNFPGIKNGKDYLFQAKKLLNQTQMKYMFDKEVFEKKIGNATFYVLEAKLNYMGITIIQEYISTVSKDFSLSFVISYTTDEEKNELYQIIDKVKI